MFLLLLCLCCLTLQAAAPADPAWAQEDGDGNRVFLDDYGYYADLRLRNAGGDLQLLRMRYIPVGSFAITGNVHPGGVFQHGSPGSEPAHQAVEEPVQRDVLSAPGLGSIDGDPGWTTALPAKGYWMAEREFPQQTWLHLLGAAPVDGFQFANDPLNPVERVTMTDVQDLLAELDQAALSAMVEAGETDPVVPGAHLPDEREWEYACRAGTATAYAHGPTLRSFKWEVDILQRDQQRYNGRQGGITIEDVVAKKFNYQDDVAQREVYLNNLRTKLGNSNYWTLSIDDDDDRVIRATMRLKVRIDVLDYFQVKPNQAFEANYDHRYRRFYIGDAWGPFAALPLRLRYLPDFGVYVEDPAVSDRDCWYRYEDDDGIHHVRRSDVLDQLQARYHLDTAVDPVYEADEDGIVIEVDGIMHELAIGAYQRITDTWLPRSAGADPENPDHWIRSERGTHFRQHYGNYERFTRITTRFNEGRYDTGGIFYGRTMPGNSVEDFPRERIQSLIAKLSMSGAVGDVGPFTIDLNATSTIDEDAEYMLEVISAARLGTTINGNAIDADTEWTYVTELEVRWDSFNNHLNTTDKSFLQSAGFGGWSGIDIAALDESELIRNPWGLLHMHGNVAEWTTTQASHPQAPQLLGAYGTPTRASGWYVVRGGSWRHGNDHCRSASRALRDGAGRSPNYSKQYDRNSDGDYADVNESAIGNFGVLRNGYDDVGFRFIIDAK